jgi:hypothetical protein
VRVLPLLGLTLTIAGFSAASAQAAGFGCSASAGRITVLGHTVEPVTSNATGSTCVGDTSALTGQAAGLPAPLSAGTLVSATEFYPAQRSILASGGIADLAISAASLPIELPKVPDAVTTAIQGVLKSVDLSAVKNAIPILPTNLVTNLVTNLRTDYGLADINLLDPAMDTLAELLQLNSVNAAINAANLATNTANAATNAADAALNQIRASIPDAVTIDQSAVANLLSIGKLPAIDLLRVRGAMAYAAGSCQSGTPAVSSSSKVAGVNLLGQELPVDQVVDVLKTLIAKTPIDPANLSVTAANLGLTQQQVDLIASVLSAQSALDSTVQTVNSTLQSALAGLPSLEIPATIAQIKITPGAQVRSGDSVTQQALGVVVSVAGQKIVDAVIGEAKASAAGVDCAAPVADPGTSEGATLQCSKRRLVLVDVLERNHRVRLNGVADPALAGKRVAIVFGATGRTVAHARVARDGSFDTTAPLPAPVVRDTNAARYTAVLGKDRSINLKLRRRMVLTSMTSHRGRVTITGRVVRPLARPRRAITLTRRVSCNEDKVVTRFRPRSNGRFRITVRAPRAVGTVVYRMRTQVLNSSSGRALFDTFTLPRAVDVQR